jgi:hypothetical protein
MVFRGLYQATRYEGFPRHLTAEEAFPAMTTAVIMENGHRLASLSGWMWRILVWNGPRFGMEWTPI